MKAPIDPSKGSPLTAEQKDLLPVLDAQSWAKEGPQLTLGEELNLDAAGTMLLGDDNLGATSHWYDD
jgi:hypothetical protein